MRYSVFIHTNRKQLLGAIVAQYAIQKFSCHLDKFDVKIIRLEDYPALYSRGGQYYLRESKSVKWNNEDLQSFTPLRFLVPESMGFEGRALVIDPDVFALSDVYELLIRDMQGKAILCRKIIPKDDRTPYYASSVMLLDCEKLTHWRWKHQIEKLFSFKQDYRPWMSLLTEDEDTIGLLEEEWNHFDTLNAQTKLLHNTGRITQPWKTGLPIDFVQKQKRHKISQETLYSTQPRSRWSYIIQLLFPKKDAKHEEVYRPHPDPSQEALFFSLLKECLYNGTITKKFLKNEIRQKRLRKDTFELIRKF